MAERHTACRIVRFAESRENDDRAGDLAAQALAAEDGLVGIYNASAGGMKVAQAIKRAGRSDVVYITHELSEQRRAFLKAGQIDTLLDQEPATEIAIALSVIARYFGRVDDFALAILCMDLHHMR
ncbi:substrate-binding domain-containing protein [Celeribacter sp.]|uniref:substrate-binding domain-containing protein n=1 Tax=Celeribacter sp. TaxID=1890673 RepID=UPI003A933DF5